MISEQVSINVKQEDQPEIVSAAKLEVLAALIKKIRKYERQGYVQQGKIFSCMTGYNGM